MEDSVKTGQALGEKHRRQFGALRRTQDEIHAWTQERITEGWSLYMIAKVLGQSASGLARKLERHEVAYEPKPKGGPRKQRTTTASRSVDTDQ